MAKHFICGLILLVLCPVSHALDCARLFTGAPLMAQSSLTDQDTQIYVALLKHLVRNKNALPVKALQQMLEEKSVPNPVNYVPNFRHSVPANIHDCVPVNILNSVPPDFRA